MILEKNWEARNKLHIVDFVKGNYSMKIKLLGKNCFSTHIIDLNNIWKNEVCKWSHLRLEEITD